MGLCIPKMRTMFLAPVSKMSFEGGGKELEMTVQYVTVFDDCFGYR